jgi:hypothetical protein
MTHSSLCVSLYWQTALRAILSEQEPFPAVVVDQHWDILQTNEAAVRFFCSAAWSSMGHKFPVLATQKAAHLGHGAWLAIELFEMNSRRH